VAKPGKAPCIICWRTCWLIRWLIHMHFFSL
jgi:hypothetical protein